MDVDPQLAAEFSVAGGTGTGEGALAAVPPIGTSSDADVLLSALRRAPADAAATPSFSDVFSDVCSDVSPYGLRAVELADQPTIAAYFRSLRQPLSDYTFSQLFSWRNSLRILWRELEGHLCVFANGTGDLTLLLPPIGETGGDRALARCWEIMDDYNAAHRVPDRSRVEYASDELLGRLDRDRLIVTPMGTDYVYDVNRMIDLAGGDLASKRQAKNRFLRNYQSRVEEYDAAKHYDGCCALLAQWKDHQDASHATDAVESASALKRQKESLATRLSLKHAADLGYKGLVVYVTDPATGVEAIKGFTFGEALGDDQSSIVIEKTDLEAKGLAQFIFSEFCRRHWADRPLVNVGDDWGLETLAWTKMSYRPVKMLQKYALAKPARIMSGAGLRISEPDEQQPQPLTLVSAAPEPEAQHVEPAVASIAPETTIRFATKVDVAAAVGLEQTCFSTYSLKKRQLQYLVSRPSNVFLVAEQVERVVGDCIALVRHHKGGLSGRVYSLAVNAECRGQKIGKRLMQRMLEELGHRGVRRAYLEVEQTNAAAVALYESLGFRTLGPLPDYYGDGRHGWHMVADVADVLGPTLFRAAVA